jgi:SAM-dependent methyltransferase
MKSPQVQTVHNDTRHSHCPCCGARAIGKIGDIHYPATVQYSSAVVNLTEQPELWQCLECQSWFTQNIVSEAESIQLYASGGFWVTKDFPSAKPNELVQYLAALLRPEMKVLDVGCANGAFLDFAQSRVAQTAGLEFSAANRALLRTKGHQSYGNWQELTDRYDLITAFDVVEHLYDLNGFLESCLEHLTPEGTLLLVTGDRASVPAQVAQANWWYLRFSEHIICPSIDYFQQHPQLRVIGTQPVYSYRFSAWKALKSLVKLVWRPVHQTPSPLLPPDHILICLGKQIHSSSV